MEVTVKAHQTLSDIAVEVYGDLRAVVMLAIANDKGVADNLVPGEKIICPEKTYDRYMQSYVSQHGVSPATAIGENTELTL